MAKKLKDINESLGKLPPQCPEEEEAVLGALILESGVLKSVIQFLKAEHFYSDINKTIYQAILDLNEINEPIDPRTVYRHLKKKGKDELIGGPGATVELTMKVSQSTNIESHARIIVEMAIKRELIQIASSIHHDAYEDTEDPIELLEKSKARIEVLNTWTDNNRSYYAPDKENIKKEWESEQESGQTSRIAELDPTFKWMYGTLNGWYGWANDGKGTFYDMLAVIKAKLDDWHFCMYKQEDMNSLKIEGKTHLSASDIHQNLVWTLTGKCPYRAYAKANNLKQIPLDELMECLNWVEEHFTIIYPKDRRFKNIMDNYKAVCEKKRIDAILADPWKALVLPDSSRGDYQLTSAFVECKEFALYHHLSFDIISHAKSMVDTKEKNGQYKVVNGHMQLGGSAWNINMDSEHSIMRPERHNNPRSTKVHHHNLKQRKAEKVGCNRGVYEDINFDPNTRRYFFNLICPIDGSRLESFIDKKFKTQEPIIDFTESKKVDEDSLPF